MTQVFNIPSNYHFFESLLEWSVAKFDGNISNVRIFLPNRRSCREFSSFLLTKFDAAKMPKLKAIADIDIDDFHGLSPTEEVLHAIEEIAQIKILDDFEYIFFLSKEISKTEIFGRDLSFDQIISIAVKLKNLFDDIECAEVKYNTLANLGDEDLSLHRQFTLDFLQKFYTQIRNLILKKNLLSRAAYQNFVVNKFAQILENTDLEAPMMIAGSTGSINYSKRLMAALAKNPQGYIMLYGLENTVSTKNSDSTHFQSILAQLLQELKISAENISLINFKKFQISGEDRQKFLSYLMLPSRETSRWQEFVADQNLAHDIKKNFCYFEAQNEIAEARFVAKAIKENAHKKIGVIINDEKFAKFLKFELQKLSIKFNDARSLDLSSSKLANLILLLIEVIESNFDSSSLLAVLKHEYLPYLQDKNLVDFEINILRKPRIKFGLEGIKEKLRSQDEPFFVNFLNMISNLINKGSKVDIAIYSANIISVIENLSNKKFAELIAAENSAKEIENLLKKLQNFSNFYIDNKNISKFFKHLFLHISYFEKNNEEVSVQLLSTIEARLLNFDLLILSSFNNDNFPQIESENWLGKKIRSEIGIDYTAKKIAQNSYDFYNYLSNKSVVITRSKSSGGKITIASPFLLRLQIFCKKIDYELLKKSESQYFSAAQKNNFDLVSLTKNLRPRQFSITEIVKLLADPYQIYAKKILQLRELDEIDYEPAKREFGSFVHAALEQFIKYPKSPEIFLRNIEKTFVKFFSNEEAKLIWLPKFENIFKNFINENKKFENCKNYVEVPVQIMIDDILIKGKIDRIAINTNNEVEIFDYKTGEAPSKNEVLFGTQMQLTIAALALCEGNIENLELRNILPKNISALSYWKLSSTSESKISSITKDDVDMQDLLRKTRKDIEDLFRYFSSDENQYFIGKKNSKFKSEYWHLERLGL